MRLISICIPAHNRPEFLRQALDSCLGQTHPNIEILVGDDSSNDLSANLAMEYHLRFPGRIVYRLNRPPLGQAANVNSLFDRATGDLLVLLHDDDWLVPDSLERLSSCWDRAPELTAAFGKQYIAANSGAILLPESEDLNVRYHRIAENAGRQAVPAIAGLLRMFPNNGYMISAEVARNVRYRPPQLVGEACDTDFGLRVCLSAKALWFLDEYVSTYRVSDDAVSKRNYLQPFAYDAIESADVPQEAAVARGQALRDLASGAASGFARLNKPKRAWGVYLSKNYPLWNRLKPKGMLHVLLIGASILRIGFRKSFMFFRHDCKP